MKLSYDQAKRLKDSGYPQPVTMGPTTEGALLFAPGATLDKSHKQLEAMSAYAPTLADLLRACPQGIYVNQAQDPVEISTGDTKIVAPDLAEALVQLYVATRS